jgi:hypothetical protein
MGERGTWALSVRTASGLVAALQLATVATPAWAQQQGGAPPPTTIGPPQPVVLGTAPPPSSPPPPVVTQPPPQTAPMVVVQQPQVMGPAPGQLPTAVVHIETDEPYLVLQVQSPGGRWDGRGEWTTVCGGSCDRPVPLGLLYRISGDGIRSSKPFEIGAQPGSRVHLYATTGSSGSFVTGIVVLSLGSASALIGLSLTLLGALVGAYCGYGVSCSGDAGLLTGGLITLGVGVVGIIIGAVLIGGNSRSTVTQVAGSNANPDALRVRWATGAPERRSPAWETARSAAGAAFGPGATAATIPIFGTAF